MRPEPAAPPPPLPPEEPLLDTNVELEYRGDTAVLLRGSSSGRLYTFSAGRRVRRMPAEDARPLLRNRLFRLAG